VEETPVTDVSSEDTPAVEIDERLVQQLADRVRADGLQLSGPNGLLAALTKRVAESALEGGEMDDHRGDPVGRDGGDSRNGRPAKTVVTEAGPVQIATPRDRDGSFEPQLVKKHQARIARSFLGALR
jgi:transposase-like protein